MDSCCHLESWLKSSMHKPTCSSSRSSVSAGSSFILFSSSSDTSLLSSSIVRGLKATHVQCGNVVRQRLLLYQVCPRVSCDTVDTASVCACLHDSASCCLSYLLRCLRIQVAAGPGGTSNSEGLSMLQWACICQQQRQQRLRFTRTHPQRGFGDGISSIPACDCRCSAVLSTVAAERGRLDQAAAPRHGKLCDRFSTLITLPLRNCQMARLVLCKAEQHSLHLIL